MAGLIPTHFKCTSYAVVDTAMANYCIGAQNDRIGWLSMVLRLRQHKGYTADGFYRSDGPTNSVKALKEGG